METWKDIPDYEGYRISDSGRVFSVKRNKVLALRSKLKTKRQMGYPTVQLSRGGKKKTIFVHRLVAAAFIGEIKKGLVVMHNDDNPKNNNASNLSIGTQRQNQLDCYSRKRRRRQMHENAKVKLKVAVEGKKKPVMATKAENGETKIFESLRSAVRELGINVSSMHHIQTGRCKTAKGYSLKYI